MKLVYESAQLTEAYIIKDILENSEIFTALHGEMLHAVVIGNPLASIRIMVNDHDYDKAKAMLKDWDNAEWDEDAWQNET